MGKESTGVPALGSRRELFVDNLLIDGMNGARLKLGEPKPGGVAVKYDAQGESGPDYSFSFYTTVIKDGETYRMYYRGNWSPETYLGVTCYAESTDGIDWTRPSLGLVDDAEGSSQTSAILPFSKQFCPFVDGRPGVPEAQRYKANVVEGRVGVGGLMGYVSPDGIRWSKVQDGPIVPSELDNHFDSQNVMFWSEVEKRYVLYARHMVGGVRTMARATSDDFLSWSGPTFMTYSDTGTTTPSEHLYTNQTQPYFRAPHIYVSLPGRILFDRRTLTAEELDFASSLPRTGKSRDCSDGVLLTSRAGTTRYDFTFRESFVRPGIGRSNWTTRNNYPALGVVQTGPAEMSFYVQRDYGQSTARLERMILRLDGFASLNASYEGGEMVTKPFTFEGDELEINYSTSAAGSVRVEVQDSGGAAVPGYELDRCRELIGDEIERVVAWDEGSSVGALAGRPVRLRFVMKDADLFSLRFVKP